MSKVHRKQEIKLKDELQARFQHSLSQSNSRVLSWLKPAAVSASQEPLVVTQDSFHHLPIIPTGSTLFTLSHESKTIGSFIDGKPSDLLLLKRVPAGGITSKAMVALKHKMRNFNRDRISKSRKGYVYSRPTLPNQTGATAKNSRTSSSTMTESDEDEATRAERFVKKGYIRPTKEKKQRPF